MDIILIHQLSSSESLSCTSSRGPQVHPTSSFSKPSNTISATWTDIQQAYFASATKYEAVTSSPARGKRLETQLYLSWSWWALHKLVHIHGNEVRNLGQNAGQWNVQQSPDGNHAMQTPALRPISNYSNNPNPRVERHTDFVREKGTSGS